MVWWCSSSDGLCANTRRATRAAPQSRGGGFHSKTSPQSRGGASTGRDNGRAHQDACPGFTSLTQLHLHGPGGSHLLERSVTSITRLRYLDAHDVHMRTSCRSQDTGWNVGHLQSLTSLTLVWSLLPRAPLPSLSVCPSTCAFDIYISVMCQ